MNTARLDYVNSLCASRGCSHVLICDPVDARYVSGFKSSNVFLLISAGKRFLFTDFRYQEAARSFCRASGVWRFGLIKKQGLGFLAPRIRTGSVLGVQSDRLCVDRYFELKRLLPGRRLVRLGGDVGRVCVVKTPAEIAVIAECARIGDEALVRTVRMLKTGMTEREAADLLEERCRRLGSGGPAFETIALFGRRSALPHGVPGRAKLRPGDFVLFDFGCTIDGLCSDMTRTFVFGKASPRQKKIYDTVLRAQRRARETIRAGMTGAQADRLARSVISSAGFGRYFGHGTGHGVGYRIHEEPRLSAAGSGKLPPGCVVTVEPGIYIPGFGGVRIEDMVHLTETSSRILTSFPSELMEIAL